MNEERLLSVTDVAVRLRKSERTIYRLIESGQLVGRKSGRDWVFTQQAVDDYLNRTKTDEQPSNA